MANRAIVVGIQGYPELTPELQGPKNDATAFYQWVTTAGGVDPSPALGHAKLILDEEPRAAQALNARPTAEAIQYQFDLLEEAGKKDPKGLAGDRLYLYLSGHGFGQSLDDAALLMANATQDRTRHHIPGKVWADYFYAKGLFKEILLFIDCCRERYATSLLNGPGPVGRPTPPDGARRFYAFSAKYGKLSVERTIDGRMSGVFTAALLDGLRGGAAEDDGEVTAESLQAYLDENMRGFLTADDRLQKDVAQDPDVYCDPPLAAKDFVIVKTPPTEFNVTVPLPPGSEGQPLQLFGEKSGQKFAKIAASPGNGSLEWKLTLVRGTYQLMIGATAKVLSVKGRGAIDVANPS